MLYPAELRAPVKRTILAHGRAGPLSRHRLRWDVVGRGFRAPPPRSLTASAKAAASLAGAPCAKAEDAALLVVGTADSVACRPVVRPDFATTERLLLIQALHPISRRVPRARSRPQAAHAL